MASLYEKEKSPFWYIQYVDSNGTRRNRSTGFRRDNPGDTVKAKTLRAQVEARELSRTGSAISGEKWETWVPSFLKRHCKTKSKGTYVRYTDAWKWVSLWLQLRHYHTPNVITYGNGIEFIDWRVGYKKKTGKSVKYNTAVTDFKVFALIMGEAVRLNHVSANPLANCKIKLEASPQKPEITDDEIQKIVEALKHEEEWMQTAFQIALHTGCRHKETRLPLSCVDFSKNKITFPQPKGGEGRAFSIPMPSALRSLLKTLQEAKRQYTLEFPLQPARKWQQFFIKLGMPHLCFHCLRVTFITRLLRAGVPRDVAMRLVNHASEPIHKIYQRERVEDVMKWRDVVQFPVAETAQESKDARPATKGSA